MVDLLFRSPTCQRVSKSETKQLRTLLAADGYAAQ